MKCKGRILHIIILCIFIITITGCTPTIKSNTSINTNSVKQKLSIVSGSENQELEPIIKEFSKQNNIDIQIDYKGSVDIMLLLQQDNVPYDAIWPANSMWISLGDKNHIVKSSKSIVSSPIAFGIKKSIAKKLNFINKPVGIKDILKAINDKKLSFVMSSASQSNSGAMAYLGFLNALLGNPEVITSGDLHKPELAGKMKELLYAVNRSSGSSLWLKELFLKGNYDAMVNYESVLIQTNIELEKQGKEPLYIIYPYDGLTMADSPLAYVNKGDSNKEEIFNELQNYLLSDEVQSKFLKLGRRTGIAGIAKTVDRSIFNPNWGINVDKILSPFKMPSTDVIREALNMYQSDFRKPSFTIFLLDYSGSMAQNGGEVKLKKTMEQILNQESAKKYLLQLNPKDKTIVIPFNDQIINTWAVDGNNEVGLNDLISNIKNLVPSGGTDFYSPAIKALDIFKNQPNLNSYSPSIILMTDGRSNQGKTLKDLLDYKNSFNKDIPIFSITFGDASEDQLNKIADITSGKVFDGKEDLINAFKQAKGYN